MTAEPRVKAQYSNHMYMALSLAIEAVTGYSLGDSFREALWHPLGMKSTYYGEKEAEKAAEHLATGYRWDSSAKKFESVPLDLLEMSAGAGAIASSINDYAKWIQCLLQESDVLSIEAHAEIRKPGIIWGPSLDPHGDLTTYGKGWLRKLYHGQVIYSHGGGCSHGTEVYWLPGKKFGIVTMGNTYKTANFVGMILAHKLLDDKLGVAEGDRIPYRTM